MAYNLNNNSLEDGILSNYGGSIANNLIQLLGDADDKLDDLTILTHSPYIDTTDLKDALATTIDKFTIFSLNVQSINSKFNYIYPLLLELINKDIGFSAICLQESWLSDDADLSQYQLPNYNIIHQGKKCSGHGGLLIYLHVRYSYIVRQLYDSSDVWEGLFINVFGANLNKNITIGNIYRPPKLNNNEQSISTFIEEFAPILSKLGKENAETIITGDFNIDLLKVNSKQKVGDYFDLFCTNGFYPKITLPTRFSRKSCTLIDQIFCKISNATTASTAGIIMSNISDHLPYFIITDILLSKQSAPKWVTIRTNNEKATTQYYESVRQSCIMDQLNLNELSDPNTNYNLLENILSRLYDYHFPAKTVRYNKYKHKKSNWITIGIINSIKHKDKLYRKLKQTAHNEISYNASLINLRVYKKYLK